MKVMSAGELLDRIRIDRDDLKDLAEIVDEWEEGELEEYEFIDRLTPHVEVISRLIEALLVAKGLRVVSISEPVVMELTFPDDWADTFPDDWAEKAVAAALAAEASR